MTEPYLQAGFSPEQRAEAHPINWTEARLRGIASDYFPDPKHWPAAILCLKHMLMEQSKAAQQAQAEPVAATPDGRLHTDGYFTWARRDGYAMDNRLPCDFYLAAQPAPGNRTLTDGLL